MRKPIFLLLILIIISNFSFATRSKAVSSIPFTMVGSYVVVELSINQSSKLNFILDTGIRNTIITELQASDSISLNYKNEKELQGLGQGKTLNAYMSENNDIKLNKKLILRNKTIYVLKEDMFNLSRQTGYKINGLLGSDFFNDYVVEIDYSRRKLRFYEPQNFEVNKAYGVMPMTIEKQKMYIHLTVLETDTARQNIKMLIDTGAELSAWFQTLTNDAISIPEKSFRGRIGEGFSGEIIGIFARVPQICIANFCVKNPIVVFPDSASISEVILRSDRDGTIGSQLLSRFNLIIDSFDKKFYFKPNRDFDKAFAYNIAGIEIAQTFAFLPQIEVVNVWRDSPAERAGIKAGDILNALNFEKVFNVSLSEIRSYFEKPSKRPLKISVQRNGNIIDFELDMKAKI